jgi:hypothetical protein
MKQTKPCVKNNHQINHQIKTMTSDNVKFHPFEINGTKYLMCKLPDQPFSTLHDPETKQIVGQWNNDEARYEITDHIAQFEMNNRSGSAQPTNTIQSMTEQQFEQHMRHLIASGAAFI